MEKAIAFNYWFKIMMMKILNIMKCSNVFVVINLLKFYILQMNIES